MTVVKKALALVATLLLAVISYGLLSSAAPLTAQLSCDCEPGIEYDSSLPSSHPYNLCALQDQTQQTSWLLWAKGQSRSVSFHFLDLLELMSRHHGNAATETRKEKGLNKANQSKE